MSRVRHYSNKSFRPQITGNRSPYAGNRSILKPRSDSSTISDSINMLEVLPPLPDQDWYIYDEDYYIGKM